MCLAMPARVVELLPGDNAVVDLGGVRKEISLSLVEEIAVGDYVILHVGYALQKLDTEEAEKTLALFAELAQSQLGDAAPDAPSLVSPPGGGSDETGAVFAAREPESGGGRQ